MREGQIAELVEHDEVDLNQAAGKLAGLAVARFGLEPIDEKRGVGFRSLTESIDTITSGGRLVFHIFAALAEFERSIIRERTRAGLDAARARGRVGGRPPALSEKDRVMVAALLRDPSLTVKEIAQRLDVAPSTIYAHFPGGRAAFTSG
jgi:DNA invertase Pin-like site-specific DNA recombinase